jgi:hypothetical protein
LLRSAVLKGTSTAVLSKHPIQSVPLFTSSGAVPMFKMLFKTLLKPPSKKLVTVYSLASGVVVVPVVMMIGLHAPSAMAQTTNSSPSKLYSLDNLGKDPLTSLSAFGLTPRADYRGKIAGDFMWLNSYKAEEGGEIINSISLTWGLPNSTKGSTGFSDWKENPRIASLLLYGDPNGDGNPNDAKLLAQSDVYITDPDTDILTKVMVTPTQFTVGQNFFVAALVRNLERIPNADPTKTFGFQSPATAELSKAAPGTPSATTATTTPATSTSTTSAKISPPTAVNRPSGSPTA